MNNTIAAISYAHLAIGFIPVLIAVLILWFWSLRAGNAFYAVARMLLQLLVIGYALAYIFAADSPLIVLLVLTVMLLAAAWIALNAVAARRRDWFVKALLSIGGGGVAVLALVTQGVLRLEPWYAPDYMIPLAGMIFANTMNSVSLAAERLEAEVSRGVDLSVARATALQAAMIPVINSLLAVGLVSLPGMMTGQILSGVSPLIAARYQIVVMCMLFGAAGISTAAFLSMVVPARAGTESD